MFTTTMGQQENRLPVNENNYDGMAGLEDDDNWRTRGQGFETH